MIKIIIKTSKFMPVLFAFCIIYCASSGPMIDLHGLEKASISIKLDVLDSVYNIFVFNYKHLRTKDIDSLYKQAFKINKQIGMSTNYSQTYDTALPADMKVKFIQEYTYGMMTAMSSSSTSYELKNSINCFNYQMGTITRNISKFSELIDHKIAGKSMIDLLRVVFLLDCNSDQQKCDKANTSTIIYIKAVYNLQKMLVDLQDQQYNDYMNFKLSSALKKFCLDIYSSIGTEIPSILN
jgi:hypothetical protein